MEMNALTVMPVMDIPLAMERYKQTVLFVQKLMNEGTDYGVIPGTDKPTLMKPGAEKLTTFFGLSKKFQLVEKVEDWTGQNHAGEPFFYYLYRCQLWRGDLLVAEADGSCNSMESKYRWRWVDVFDVPHHLDKSTLKTRVSRVSEFEFAINKAETTGKYGKSDEYWQRFKDAIEDGTAHKISKQTNSGKQYPAWEIESTGYRIPNDDIASQVNTIQKMSQKRALIAATLLAVNASEFFTQDMEDYVDDGAIIDVAAKVIDPKPEAEEKTKPANGNGHANGANIPTNPAKLLELVNSRVEVPYDNVSHLFQAIKKAAGGDFAWPNPKDKDAWKVAYDRAVDHAKKKTSSQPPAEPVEEVADKGEIPF